MDIWEWSTFYKELLIVGVFAAVVFLIMVSVLAVVYFGLRWIASRINNREKQDSDSRQKNITNLVDELTALVSYGVDSTDEDDKITLDKFPYHLSEHDKVRVMSAAFFVLSKPDLSRHTENMTTNKRVMISGSSELYNQTFAKALANSLDSKLLILDIDDFTIKFSRKHGLKISGAVTAKYGERILQSLKSSFYRVLLPWRCSKWGMLRSFANYMSAKVAPTNPKTTSFDMNLELLMDALYQVLSQVSSTSPVILYLRHAEWLVSRRHRCIQLEKMFKKLEGRILILGSRVVADDVIATKYVSLFPYIVEFKPPEDKAKNTNWKKLLEKDKNMIQYEDERNRIIRVLARVEVECDDIESLSLDDTIALSNQMVQVDMINTVICLHVMKNKNPNYRNGKLLIPAKSLSEGLKAYQNGKCPQKNGSNQNYLSDNEYEKWIRTEVISPDKIDVTFDDIGALEDTKELLEEVVMLPIKRPDIFVGGILKPCKGVLLFGPPGTGKTMLAKAIAKEAGASFINVSMSGIESKWVGESEKNIRAIFTVAAKVSPAIIFIDEVDSLLSKRRSYEAEYVRRAKNEFMSNWDGLTTTADQRILVLGATNRPYDLDDAVIRRFERRIMVDLPDVKNREAIFRTILANEERLDEKIDYNELATMTEGYTGSDLKNLCKAAAYRPVRELLKKEKLKNLEKQNKAESSSGSSSSSKACKKKEKEKEENEIRPLKMEDFKEAKNEVPASYESEGNEMEKIRSWNKLYGAGGGGGQDAPKILTYYI